ncbi:MAG: hypothetical protein AAF411_32165, partial [Myxococcota bacterium]
MSWMHVDGRGRRLLAVLTVALGCGGEAEAPSESSAPPEAVEDGHSELGANLSGARGNRDHLLGTR